MVTITEKTSDAMAKKDKTGKPAKAAKSDNGGSEPTEQDAGRQPALEDDVAAD